MSKAKAVKVIEVRYRDIPWEEARKCQTIKDEKTCRRHWEQEQRGRYIFIEIPAIRITPCKIVCAGPFFALHVASRNSPANTVCPHIAEIGD